MDLSRPSPSARPTERRADLQGLRAVAMLVVAVYHIWTARVSGGVDVFLALSAYFLAGSLVRRLERGEGLGLRAYWTRTFSRLIGPAAVVIGATALLVIAFLPSSHERSMLDQAWASATYRENLFLARQSTDYYSLTGRTQSAFQQFWSLSVQGFVFLAWPLVIGVGAALAKVGGRLRGRPMPVRPVVASLFGGIAVASFAWSLHRTATAPLPAYFETWPRLWEFALGSLLALGLPGLARRVHVGPRVAGTMTTLGLLGLIAAGALLPSSLRYPGWVAIVPLTCAGLVIAGGALGDVTGSPAYRVLAARPMQRLADVSYGFYLWHWPVLVTYLALTDHDPVTLPAGIGLLALSVALATATHALVERPVQTFTRSGPVLRRGVAVLGVSALLLGVSLTGWRVDLEERDRAYAAAPESQYPGAQVLAPSSPPVQPVSRRMVRPSLTRLADEWADVGPACEPSEIPPAGFPGDCTWRGAEKPERTLWMIGDSHAAQLMAALDPVAHEQGWRIVFLRRNACRFKGPGSGDPDCDAFNAAAAQWALKQKPDALLVVGSLTYADGRTEELAPGLEGMLRPFLDASVPVISFRDNPRFARSMAECVDLRGPSSPRCSRPVGETLAATDPVAELAAREPLVRRVDLTSLYCPNGACPAVIGNVLVYLDDNHLTATYLRTAVPEVRRQLLAALPD